MKINKNVDMMGLDPSIKLVIDVAKELFHKEGSICEITSLKRPVSKSYHSQGLAVDFGVDNFPKDSKSSAHRVADGIRRNLPDYVDVVYGVSGHYNHIHVEIDLKKYHKWHE